MHEGFVIVEVKEMLTPDEIIQNALMIVNKQETFMRYIANIQYYIFAMILSFVNIVYYKTFDIRVDEKPFGTLVVLDHGIRLCNAFLPYESLIKYGYKGDTMYLSFFHKSKKHNFTFQVHQADRVANIIKNNMFYHLKYNKLDKDLVSDFTKLD
jgi:hypothetical protein